MLVCSICGAPYVRPHRKGPVPAVCSERCAAVHKARRERQRRADRRAAVTTEA